MADAPDWRHLFLIDLDLAPFEIAQIGIYYHPALTLGDLVQCGRPWFDYHEALDARVFALVEEAQARHPIAPHRERPLLPRIDYALLGQAVAFYEACDYRYVEAPWAVSDETVAITCPRPENAARVSGLGALVGSSEQSFLHLDLAGLLGRGQFVACTPCFRLGDDRDDLHFPTFMKVELYDNTGIGDVAWKAMLADARQLALDLGAPASALTQDRTEEGRDLMLGGIEIGSFGRRRHGDHEWSYGTGLALPRFSQALARALETPADGIPYDVWRAAGVDAQAYSRAVERGDYPDRPETALKPPPG